MLSVIYGWIVSPNFYRTSQSSPLLRSKWHILYSPHIPSYIFLRRHLLFYNGFNRGIKLIEIVLPIYCVARLLDWLSTIKCFRKISDISLAKGETNIVAASFIKRFGAIGIILYESMFPLYFALISLPRGNYFEAVFCAFLTITAGISIGAYTTNTIQYFLIHILKKKPRERPLDVLDSLCLAASILVMLWSLIFLSPLLSLPLSSYAILFILGYVTFILGFIPALAIIKLRDQRFIKEKIGEGGEIV